MAAVGGRQGKAEEAHSVTKLWMIKLWMIKVWMAKVWMIKVWTIKVRMIKVWMHALAGTWVF